MYEVGDLWAANRISVATEHMATAIAHGLVNRAYEDLPSVPGCGRKMVLATTQNESHTLGTKMVMAVLYLHGWDSLSLTSGQGVDDVLTLLAQEKPDLLGFSMTFTYHEGELQKELAQIREAYPELPILIGGRAVNDAQRKLSSLSGLRFIKSLYELESLLEEVSAQ
jgi:methanogenic corrinoid protein MtbC1